MKVKLLGCFFVAVSCSGCLAPALLGVKDIQTAGGTRISFITGTDFRIGANGVDTVKDERGIKPDAAIRATPVQYKE